MTTPATSRVRLSATDSPAPPAAPPPPPATAPPMTAAAATTPAVRTSRAAAAANPPPPSPEETPLGAPSRGAGAAAASAPAPAAERGATPTAGGRAAPPAAAITTPPAVLPVRIRAGRVPASRTPGAPVKAIRVAMTQPAGRSPTSTSREEGGRGGAWNVPSRWQGGGGAAASAMGGGVKGEQQPGAPDKQSGPERRGWGSPGGRNGQARTEGTSTKAGWTARQGRSPQRRQLAFPSAPLTIPHRRYAGRSQGRRGRHAATAMGGRNVSKLTLHLQFSPFPHILQLPNNCWSGRWWWPQSRPRRPPCCSTLLHRHTIVASRAVAAAAAPVRSSPPLLLYWSTHVCALGALPRLASVR